MQKIIIDRDKSTGTTVLQDNNSPLPDKGCSMVTRSVDQESSGSFSKAGLPILEEAESIATINNLSDFNLQVEVITSTGIKNFDVFTKNSGPYWSLVSSTGYSLDLLGDVCKYNKYKKRADLTILLSYFVGKLAGVIVIVNTKDKGVKRSMNSYKKPPWKN